MTILSNDPFSQAFGRISQGLTKLAFEVRFNAVQRGLLQQRDKEIQKAQDTSGLQRRVADLQKQRDDLAKKTNALIDLQTDLKTNALRFLDINEAAQAAIDAADTNDDQVLTADEATALNTAKGEIFDQISKIKFFTTVPDFTDGQLANRIRQDADTLAGYTAEAGAIDAEGVDPATNDNRDLLATLATIVSRSVNFADSSTTLYEGINQFIIDSQKNAYSLEADLQNLTKVKLAEQQTKVDDINVRYANLIKAISLAFEVQSGVADMLVTGTQPTPPAGSILNLFA